MEFDTATRTTDSGSGARPRLVRTLLVFATLVAILVAFFWFDVDHFLSIEMLVDNRDWLMVQVARNEAFIAVAFLAVYALTVAASVPGATLLTIGGGFLFGTMAGAVYAVAGATIGAIALFLFIRAGMGNSLRAGAGTSVERFRRGFQDDAFGYLLFLRLLPLVPFWFVNIAAAVLQVPLRTFVIATALGIVPGTLVYASFGSSLGFLLGEEGTGDIGSVLTPQVLLPLIGLALLALAPVIYKKVKGRAGGAS
jgi:uncharacterized membrane protein YdjX (TVP38/TMEM64 family)